MARERQLSNNEFTADQKEKMNKWHESVYGYPLNESSIEFEKLLRIKYGKLS